MYRINAVYKKKHPFYSIDSFQSKGRRFDSRFVLNEELERLPIGRADPLWLNICIETAKNDGLHP